MKFRGEKKLSEDSTDKGNPEVLDPVFAIINREFLQIGVLVVLAMGIFFFTRAIASNNRSTTMKDASTWYERGRAFIAAGQVDSAVTAFRTATLKNRSDRRYALALARALAQTHDSTGARNALLSLRQSAPEDPEVNVELARLAVTRDSVQEAVRYYQNALYAPWPAGAEAQRRAVRLEMIRLLLARGDSARAVPELLAYQASMPDSLHDHIELGRMFSRVGENRRAVQQFEIALQQQPHDTAAIVGAARASFELADYGRSALYLRRIPRGVAGVEELRETVEWRIADDPFVSRTGIATRARRLSNSATYELTRLNDCLQQKSYGTENINALILQIQSLKSSLSRQSPQESMIDRGAELLAASAHTMETECGSLSPRERAFKLIEEDHSNR